MRNAIAMLFLSLMMSCFTGIMAQIVVYLPWTPVPVTGQTLAVLLAGIVLGKWGAMSQVLYIAIGLAGHSMVCTHRRRRRSAAPPKPPLPCRLPDFFPRISLAL